MNKKSGLILLLAAAFLFMALMTMPAPAEDKSPLTGAVAKIPVPLTGRNISLESQKVKIIVYSTFIEVDAEYMVKNNNKNDITVNMGFPVNLHSLELSQGESPVLDFQAVTGKKDEDYYVKTSIDGDDSRDNDRVYKKWYRWDMDIKGGRSEKIKAHYYIKMDRSKGVPNFAYALRMAKTYTGNIRNTEITVNMPVNCKDLPFTTTRLYKGGSYLFASFPKPAVSRNVLTWRIEDLEPRENLEIYFYKNGYPGWEVTASSEDSSDGNVTANLIDGDPRTFWSNDQGRKAVGSWLQFRPFMEQAGEKKRTFEPKIYQVAIIPGNGEDLTKFYQYSHLLDADMVIKEEKSEEPQSEEDEKQAQQIKKRMEDIINIDCTADWSLQLFKTKKKPLDTVGGPAQLTIKSIYPGQKFNTLCISEVLIFDREEKETYDEM